MTNNFIKNGIYNTITGIVRIFLGITTVPILIRILGVEEYGIWTLVSSLVGMMMVMEGGFGTATTFFVAQDVSNDNKEELSQTITITLLGITLLATLGSLCLGLGADAITQSFPKLDPSQYHAVTIGIQLSAILLWSKLGQLILGAISQGYQQYQEISAISTLQTILQYVGIVGTAYLGGKTIHLMFYQSILSIVFLGIYAIVAIEFFKTWKIKYCWDTKKALIFLKYSISVWTANLGSVLFNQVDKIVVGYFAEPTILGIYGTITNIVSQINVISAAPVQPILPLLTNYRDRQETGEIYAEIEKALQINCLVAIGLGSILMIGGKILLTLILKTDVDAQILLAYQLGVSIYTIYSLNAVGYYICFANSLVKYCMSVVIFSGILSLILIKFGLEQWGLIGAILGNGGYIITCLLVSKGMNQMKVEFFQWVSWISYPIISFSISSLVSIIYPEGWLALVTQFLSLGIIAIWFSNSKIMLNFKLKLNK